MFWRRRARSAASEAQAAASEALKAASEARAAASELLAAASGSTSAASEAPELTEAAYLRWLRARRPPFELSLSLEVEEQEVLANLGDMYERDRCVGIGAAVRDPEGASLGARAAAGDEAAEESLLDRLARVAAQRNAPPQPAPSDPLSMGGITARRAQRQHEKLVKKDAGRSFMGRPPDRRTPPAEVEEGAA